MRIERFEIEGPLLFFPKRHGDERGFFVETFRQDVFEREAGVYRFVQDNHSFSARKGTLRGLHYQAPPAAQGKLVRVTCGAVFDVAVDIRHGSPTFGRHVAVTIDAGEGQVFWIPPGFLHGFCTLGENTDFLYKVTDYYSPEHDGSVCWNDPDLAIEWPSAVDEATLSGKDRVAPRLRDLPRIF